MGNIWSLLDRPVPAERSQRGTLLLVATLLLLLVGVAATAHAQGSRVPPPPEREAKGNTLTSAGDPAIIVRVPDVARYIGTRRILLNERFDAELHVFVEADEHGLIERFYWFQFERHLPDAPGRYDYRMSNPEIVLFDGIAVHMRPGGANTREETIPPGSDYAAFRSLVAGAGLRLPTWLTTLRLVHLFEPTERAELMVVYGEGPDALAEAAAEAMRAGEPGLTFADMLSKLIEDVDARIDLELLDPIPPDAR